jgi:hypothetical protein
MTLPIKQPLAGLSRDSNPSPDRKGVFTARPARLPHSEPA